MTPNLIVCPAASHEAQEHYVRSVAKKVDLKDCKEKLRLDGDLGNLLELLGSSRVWGLAPMISPDRNLSIWNRIRRNDLVTFYGGNEFNSICKVIAKCHSKPLAEYLWDNHTGLSWDYIFFIDRPIGNLALNRNTLRKSYVRQHAEYLDSTRPVERGDAFNERDYMLTKLLQCIPQDSGRLLKPGDFDLSE